MVRFDTKLEGTAGSAGPRITSGVADLCRVSGLTLFGIKVAWHPDSNPVPTMRGLPFGRRPAAGKVGRARR